MFKTPSFIRSIVCFLVNLNVRFY